MKKFILPVALGLFCCAALTRPASADVTGSIDTIDLVFSNTAGQTATATSNVSWTVHNGNGTSASTNMKSELYYIQTPPYADYRGWEQDYPTTTSANDSHTYSHAFDGTVYPQYAYNNQFRADGTLSGLSGFPVTASAAKSF